MSDASHPVVSLRSLPLVEHWDCHQCAECCRGITVPLDAADVRRLAEQGWAQRPEYRGVRIVRRRGWRRPRFELGKRPDRSCVFLQPNGRCLIHAELGEAAKPRLCRAFPVQVVPLDQFAYVTIRRCCPSAALRRGRATGLDRDDIRRMAELRQARPPAAPPPLTPGERRPWRDVLRVAETLERLMLDARYPPVRRLMHGLAFCSLLESCRLRRLDSAGLGELVDTLEAGATAEAGPWFQDRQPPRWSSSLLFRGIALDYLRLHPRLILTGTLGERFRMARGMLAIAVGRGRIPSLGPGFPGASLSSLDHPLGVLLPAVLAPLNDYFEAAAASKQYAILGRSRWALSESFRALALTYPVALWMLRFCCQGRPPAPDDMVGVIGAIERGQLYQPMCGTAHRARLAVLARRDQLQRLVAWYAR